MKRKNITPAAMTEERGRNEAIEQSSKIFA